MNALATPFRQMVDRKLWPLAILLIAAIAAVPMLLKKEQSVPAPPQNARCNRQETGRSAASGVTRCSRIWTGSSQAGSEVLTKSVWPTRKATVIVA